MTITYSGDSSLNSYYLKLLCVLYSFMTVCYLLTQNHVTYLLCQKQGSVR